MTSFKFVAIVLAVGFATAIGCGSDSSNNVDAPIVGSTGGTKHLDAGAGGAGGSVGPDGGSTVTPDAPLGTGGTGGMDGGAIDGPLLVIDAAQSEAGNLHLDTGTVDLLAGEVAAATDLCTGLTPSACDLTIRNLPVDSTVTAQDVPESNPPAYLTCSQ